MSGSEKNVRRRVITPTNDPTNVDPLLRPRGSQQYEVSTHFGSLIRLLFNWVWYVLITADPNSHNMSITHG